MSIILYCTFRKTVAHCDLTCSDIRKNMDAKYDEILQPEEQRQIETLPAPDFFKLEDGKFDPKMRQVTIDASKTIKELDEVMIV